jgi:hypothetical protein
MRLWLGVLAIACIACTPRGSTPAAAPDLLVSVRPGAVTAPDSVAPGWSRLRVEEVGDHIVVIFRLVGDSLASDVATFIATLDTARVTPASAVALGGPEIGSTGEVVVELTPGRYVLGCVRRADDGHRHVVAGEAKVLVVTASPVVAERAAAPTATVDVPMTDFAYPGSDRWAAGAHVLKVENRGAQDHQLRLMRLRDGSTLASWQRAEEPMDHVTPVAGVARLGPGAVAYLPVDLPRGEYVIHCLVADRASGKPHVMLGMFRGIHVE